MVFARACLWSKINSVNILHLISFKIRFNITLPSVPRLPKWCFLSGILTKILCIFLVFPMYATFLTYLILLELITLIIFGGEHKHEAAYLRFYPTSCYFLPLWSKYSPQCPVFSTLELTCAQTFL